MCCDDEDAANDKEGTLTRMYHPFRRRGVVVYVDFGLVFSIRNRDRQRYFFRSYFSVKFIFLLYV